MLITREELAAIKHQAVAEYPNECCGVILVRGAERRHMPCRNVQDQMHARDPITFSRTARNAYYMDPIDALKLNRLADEGFAFAVIYHSHPNAGAYFSETDRGQALIKGEPAYPGAVYVVVSVVGRDVKGLAAYRWNAERRVFDRADAGDLDPAEPAVSRRLLAAAARASPGGVRSPVRAFRSVGGEPRFVARAEGARLWDAAGRAYLDFVGSWGPLVLGHAPRAVVEAVTAAAAGGTSYGAPTRQEVELAEAIATAYPSMELVRLVSSGTAPAMSAIRVPRGATGRDPLATGFRVAYGRGQELYGVRPDLTCLGKIIGGGLPVGAYGGRRDVMDHVAPLGGVYQAGTLSGNPLAVAAGLATLRALEDRKAYARLDALGLRLERGLRDAADKAGIPFTLNRVGSMLTGFFCAGPVRDYAAAKTADTARYARFYHGMLDRGVYLAPSQFEAAFVSLAHGEDDLDHAARAAADAMAAAV